MSWDLLLGERSLWWDALPGPSDNPWSLFDDEAHLERCLAGVLGESGWTVTSQPTCDHVASGSGKVARLRPDLHAERARRCDTWPDCVATIAIECKVNGGEVEAVNQAEAYMRAYNWRKDPGQRRRGQLRRPDIVVVCTAESANGYHNVGRYPGLTRLAWSRGIGILELERNAVQFHLGNDRSPVVIARRP